MRLPRLILRLFRKPAGAPVALVLQSIQDWDLAQPLLQEFLSRSISLKVIAQSALLKKRNMRLVRGLRALRLPAHPLPEDLTPAQASAALTGCRALVSIAETSLSPHRFAHTLTLAANAAATPTYTMQHGYENVGLTYADPIDRIEDVRIASNTIFVWCPQDDLHPLIDPTIKARTLSVGCPKPASPNKVAIPILDRIAGPIVGIFENLHWHRYSDAYRAGFMAMVTDAARARPGLTFLIKPHSAARWLVKSGTDLAALPKNIVVADPGKAPWSRCTAPQLFDSLTAVVTTPSTVALDAVRYGLPTALVKFDLDLPYYEPLLQLSGTGDLLAFIDAAGPESPANATFLARHLVAGNATARIVEKVLQDSGD